MGFYNKLFAEVACEYCKAKSPGIIQFKYGTVAQLDYHIGDKLAWNGFLEIGHSSLDAVKAYGIIESIDCPFCHRPDIPEEYDIFITNNVLTGLAIVQDFMAYVNYRTATGGGAYVPIV